ncbi:hypothetical protein BDV96DRAFT_597413 [Lophiotrema nucula]|uniref:Uncharacterized protein n=1 Tax=Lophiotrema nucula TaxID=690887 RepID=A0A6A5ZGH9_9PLEO|nr:hypothetical protein BDV96DRAFT_597413 [Lophiotrema nucula]
MADSPSGSPAVLTPTSSQETLDRGDPNALADSEAPSTNGPKSESESESDAEDEKNSKTSQESENDKAKEKEKGGIKWDLPRSEVHLAFGPEKYYFLRCGSNWRFVRSNSSVWKELDILNPTWVAFKHNTGFVICGEDVDDSQRTTIVHTWNDNFNVLAKDIDACGFLRQLHS